MTPLFSTAWEKIEYEKEQTALRQAVATRDLRAAAERVCWFDWSGNDSDAVAAVEDLRSALAR